MSLKEKVLFKVSMVSAGNITNAVMSFVYLTAVAKYLDLDSFGKYALLSSLIVLIGRITDFGTNSLFVADREKDRNSAFLISKLLLFSIALPVGIATLTIFNLDTPQLLSIFTLGLTAYTFNFTLYAYYQKSQRYFEAVLINTFPAIIRLVFAVLVFLNLIKLDLNSFFAVFACANFASILVYFLYPIKISGAKILSFSEVTQLLKKSISPGISVLIYESWSTVNNALTKIFNTFTDVGVFSMANKISNIFYLLSFSIFTVLLPKNAERKTNKKGYDFVETGIISSAVFVMSLAAIVVSEIFLSYMFGDKFKDSMKFLALLIFSNAITAVQNFVENYFYVEKRTDYLVKINLTKLVLLVSLASYAIPRYGLTSLATANLIAALIGITVTFTLIRKIEKSKVLVQS